MPNQSVVYAVEAKWVSSIKCAIQFMFSPYPNSDRPCPFLTACASRYLAGTFGDSDAALKQLVATLE